MCSGDVAHTPHKRAAALVAGLAAAPQAWKQPKITTQEQMTHMHVHGSAVLSAGNAALARTWQQLPLPVTCAMPAHGTHAQPCALKPTAPAQVDMRQLVPSGEPHTVLAHAGRVPSGTDDGLSHIMHAAHFGVQPVVAASGGVGELPAVSSAPWWPAGYPLHNGLPANLHGLVNFMLDTQIAAHFQQHADAVPAREPIAGVQVDISNAAAPGNDT